MNGYEQVLNIKIERMEVERAQIQHVLNDLNAMTENMGYALECIRQLVQLAEEAEVDAAVCVRVARRFLAEMEGGKQ